MNLTGKIRPGDALYCIQHDVSYKPMFLVDCG